jgi:site-specific DNA recombinase
VLKDNDVRAKNEKIHKYAGVLKCGECGKGFVARSRKTQSKDNTITYVCATFHKYSSSYCGSHRVMEEDIDEIVFTELKKVITYGDLRLEEVDRNIEDRLSRKKEFEKAIERLKLGIYTKKEEIKNYSRQLAKNFISEDIFSEMVGESTKELQKLEIQLSEYEEKKECYIDEKELLVKSLDIMKKIIMTKELTNTTVSILIDRIILKETEEMGEYNKPKLDLEIVWNTPIMNIVETEKLREAV